MKIVVGLGNPGDEYKNTRHNAGFLGVDHLAEHFGCEEWTFMKKTNCHVVQCTIGGQNVICAKPNSYMNESGMPVQALLQWHKLDHSNLIVMHDDTDLTIGTMKTQTNRGSAGHKGIASIIQHLGTQDFERVRLGVRPQDDATPSIDLVLRRFSEEDLHVLRSTFSEVEAYIKESVK